MTRVQGEFSFEPWQQAVWQVLHVWWQRRYLLEFWRGLKCFTILKNH